MVRPSVRFSKFISPISILMVASLAQAAVVLSWSSGQLTVTIDEPIVFTADLSSDLTDSKLGVVFKDVYNSAQNQQASTATTINLQTPTATGSNQVFASFAGTDVAGTDLVLRFNYSPDVTLQNGQTVTLSAGSSSNFIIETIAQPDNTSPSVFYLVNYDDGSYISAAVPEPGIFALISSAMIGLLVIYRRRKSIG